MSLENKHCVPCSVGAKPLDEAHVTELLQEVDGWEAVDNKRIEKTFSFPDFKTAWDFGGEIAELAEEEQHHPELRISWGKVIVRLQTLKIKGLHENDFILAGKIDQLARENS